MSALVGMLVGVVIVAACIALSGRRADSDLARLTAQMRLLGAAIVAVVVFAVVLTVLFA